MEISNRSRPALVNWDDVVNAEQKVLFTTFSVEPKRLALYVCPECGDLGCGAITCDISRVGDKVVWSRFGLDNGYAEPDFESYAHIGPFEFDIREYLAVIERATAGEA